MKLPVTRETLRIWIEIDLDSFHARTAEGGIDLPLERGEDGRLTADSVEQIKSALQTLRSGTRWLSLTKLYCAVGSRGLILRTISLPAAAPAEIPRLLQLQIESEFPLPPEALAWGWLPAPTQAALAGPNLGRQEVLVAAVKKDVIEELSGILNPGAAEVVFTAASLARLAAVPATSTMVGVLHLGTSFSELTLSEGGKVPVIRLLSWGENRLIEGLVSKLGISRTEASKWLTDQATAEANPIDPAHVEALQDAANRLVGCLPAAALKGPFGISGSPHLVVLMCRLLKAHEALPNPPQALPVPIEPGQTAATLGMARRLSDPARSPSGALLVLRTESAEAPEGLSGRLPRRSLAIVAALLVAVLAFPYLEAVIFKPHLARQLATLKASDPQLSVIDRELSFLRYLEQNQAPHLDAVYVIAQSAPAGARIDSFNINRQGEVSLTGYFRDLAQIGEFRLKLVNTGFFSTVVVEDQSPTPDRQRINFRINARWKDAADREALSLGPVLPPPSAGSATNTNSVVKLPLEPSNSVPVSAIKRL